MLQAIRMCLWPTVANGSNTPRLLVSLGCALGTYFTSGIILLLVLTWFAPLWSVVTVSFYQSNDVVFHSCGLICNM